MPSFKRRGERLGKTNWLRQCSRPTRAAYPDAVQQVRHAIFVNSRGDEAIGSTWSDLDITALGHQEQREDSPDDYPQSPPYE
jgi:predicted dithiol-disulfide oxidoreductase (DUF899 family)